jgi:quinol monooxygenase YgiN
MLTASLMVRLNVVLNSGSPRGVEDLLDALRFVIAGTRLEPGCLGCSAWADPDLTVHYVESWSTSLLAVVESLRAPPHFQFDFVSASRGLDYVAEVRGELLD